MKKCFVTKLDTNDALKIEMKTAFACQRMEETGFPLDLVESNKQIEALQERVDWVDEAVLPFIPPKPKLKGTEVHKVFKLNGTYTKQVEDWFPYRNSAKCLKCGDDIESTHRHDFVWCSCENLAVDGGREYDKRVFSTTQWVETSSTPEIVEGPFCRIEWEPINLGSSKQVNEWLLENGWQPTEWNFKKDKRGKEIQDEFGRKTKTSPKLTMDSLEDLEQLGIAGKLIAYRRKCTHKRNQIQGFIKNMRSDGRVPSVVNTIGAATRRMTHSIIANVPAVKEGQFWKPMRKVFWSGHKDYVVVGADADQCQVRGLAHYMQDSEFTEALVNGVKAEGTDMHSLNAERAGVSRNHAKNVFYGYLFGAGVKKTATQIGCSEREAKKIRDKFESGLSAMVKLQNKLIKFYRENGYITGIDGVPIYAESEHMLLVYLLQNFEVVLMKVALCYAMDRIKKNNIDATMVTMQHDEFQFICHKDDAKRLEGVLERCIEAAGRFIGSECPVKGEAQSGSSWYYSH